MWLLPPAGATSLPMYQLCAAERSQTPNSPVESVTELVQLTVRAAPTVLLTVPVGALMVSVGVGVAEEAVAYTFRHTLAFARSVVRSVQLVPLEL